MFKYTLGCRKSTNCQNLQRGLSYCNDFLDVIRNSKKLHVDYEYFVGCGRAYRGSPKVTETTNFQYFLKGLGIAYCIDFWHVVEHSWKLIFDHVISTECGQAYQGMVIVLGNNKSIILREKVELLYWVFACS